MGSTFYRIKPQHKFFKTLQNSALNNILQIICTVLPYSTILINSNGHHICHAEVIFKSFYLNCFEFVQPSEGHKRLTCYYFELCSDLGSRGTPHRCCLHRQHHPFLQGRMILTLQLQAENRASRHPTQHLYDPTCLFVMQLV